MKTITKVIMITTLITTTAQAGILSSLALNAGLPKVEPIEKYQLETPGTNARVYEFESKSSPNITCFALFGNENLSFDCVNTRNK